MKINAVSATPKFYERRNRAHDRRAHFSKVNSSSEQRAEHASHIWLDTGFAAQLIGQIHIGENSNRMEAQRAYDRIINPYLRPLHSRKA